MISTAVSSKFAKGMVAAQDRHQTKREELLSLYRKAVAVIKEKPRWASGEILTLHNGLLRGRPTQVLLKNENGTVYLSLFMEGQGGRMDKRFYSQPLAIGLLKPDTGWVVCGVNEYLVWNRQVRKAMEEK